jgi:ribosomal protein L40E
MRDFTDSYCERCGTRYTFGPTPSKGPSLTGARVLAKGLKNFVMNDEASLDDAMASARIDVERGETTRIAEEFHRTFNFCMTCRQYACDRCWNPDQGACISCAPLWDQESVAPEVHPIIRTPLAQRALDGIAPTTRPTADAGVGGVSPEAVPWPSEDPLPGRPEPRRNVKHASESMTSVPELAQPAPAAQPTESVPATQPTRSPALEPQAEIARSTAIELRAAPEPQVESQSWGLRDDAWTLWPTPEEAERAELTPGELLLVQAQLSHPSSDEEPDFRVEASSPSHTLDEDTARLAQHEPGPGTDPETLARGTSEPVAPAPARPHRAPVIGRLLGHRNPVARPAHEETPKVPEVLKAPKPALASEPDSTGQADPWPQATLWAQRPIERHDPWADPDAAPLQEAAAEPDPLLTAQADEAVPADRRPETAPTPATPAQEPLVTLPPVTVERWPAIEDEVISRPAVGSPAHDPLDGTWAIPASPAKGRPPEPASVASQSAEAPAPWPPIGARWPPQNAAATPWPGPDPALLSASVAAARQAERAESPPIATIWAESAQEVLNRGNVRVCRHCALPVSTHARFCRRCGTQQS